MSELSVSWLAVASSAWRLRLRRLASALTAGSLAGPTSMLLSNSEVLAATVAGSAMLVAGWLAGRSAPAVDGSEWCIAAEGAIAVRRGPDLWRDVAPEFASPLLIVLRCGDQKLEIWRDATPVHAFRRLSVAVRWRAPAGALTRINRSDATERT